MPGPLRGTDDYPGGDPQRHPPGPSIGPAAPFTGGTAASAEAAEGIGRGWGGEGGACRDLTRI